MHRFVYFFYARGGHLAFSIEYSPLTERCEHFTMSLLINATNKLTTSFLLRNYTVSICLHEVLTSVCGFWTGEGPSRIFEPAILSCGFQSLESKCAHFFNNVLKP